MKQSKAVLHLRIFMRVLQRYRSIVKEELGPGSGELHLSDEFAAELWPWVFGNKCPLPALSKILDTVDAGGELAPMDYYNMMVILDRFMPEVKMAISVELIAAGEEPLSDELPSTAYLREWQT